MTAQNGRGVLFTMTDVSSGYRQFFVSGVPAPKGSFRVFRNKRTGAPIIAKDSPKTESWHKAVLEQASQAQGNVPPIKGAVVVALAFLFELPKSKKASEYMSVRPDCDKLARATLDPLNGILYEDDARIVALNVTKRYVTGVGSTGCFISAAPAVGPVWPYIDKGDVSV